MTAAFRRARLGVLTAILCAAMVSGVSAQYTSTWIGNLNGAVWSVVRIIVSDAIILGAATTSGARIDLESGEWAIREGDDSAYLGGRIGSTLRFGGTTSGVPMWKANGNGFDARTADDGGYALVTVADLSVRAVAGALGYGSGVGDTQTQATSKTTGVTMNTPTGQITTNNAALAAGAEACFTVTNSRVAAKDTPYLVHASGGTAGAYNIYVGAVAAGSFSACLSNVTGGSLSEAIVINFNLIRGA